MALESKYKKIYLELMRIFCAGLVIFNHLPGYSLYQRINGKKRLLCMVLSVITRINVPIFFMISGALLLGKQEDYITVYKKRVSRTALLIVFAEVAFYFCVLGKQAFYHKHAVVNIGELIRGILSGDTGPTAYWYLYSYLGFLLFLPMFQRIAKGMNKYDVLVLFVLHFILISFLPVINQIMSAHSLDGFSLHPKFLVPFAKNGVFFYPLIGYYLDQKVDIRALSSKFFCLLTVAAVLGIAATCACTFYQGAVERKFTQDYIKIFDYVIAVTVFLWCKRLMVVHGQKISEGMAGKVICFVGSLTLGIYVFDPMLRKLFIQSAWFPEKSLICLLSSFAWIIASMTLSGALTCLLRLIPGMKKML